MNRKSDPGDKRVFLICKLDKLWDIGANGALDVIKN